jgi:hypothetical protein
LKFSLKNHGVVVELFDLSNNLIKKFPILTSTGKYFGLSDMTISRYLDKNKIYDSYVFK